MQAFYFPSYEQLASSEANSVWLEAQGIPISSTARWATGNACYSAGWALGTLKYFDGNQIQTAYETGHLLPEDILLTDGVPAEMPFVSGILSLLPSTPSSHVAMLARTFNVPFGHLAIPADANHAQQLIGRFVMVGVSEQGDAGNIAVKDMTGLLTEAEKNLAKINLDLQLLPAKFTEEERKLKEQVEALEKTKMEQLRQLDEKINKRLVEAKTKKGELETLKQEIDQRTKEIEALKTDWTNLNKEIEQKKIELANLNKS